MNQGLNQAIAQEIGAIGPGPGGILEVGDSVGASECSLAADFTIPELLKNDSSVNV